MRKRIYSIIKICLTTKYTQAKIAYFRLKKNIKLNTKPPKNNKLSISIKTKVVLKSKIYNKIISFKQKALSITRFKCMLK